MTKNTFWVLTLVALGFAACKKEETVTPSEPLTVETINNLFAPNDEINRETGEIIKENNFVKFSFSAKDTVSDDSWDLAFKGTKILVNGGTGSENITRTGHAGAIIKDGIFEEMLTAPEDSEYRQDSGTDLAVPTGSNNGWYVYNDAAYLITPIAGKVIFVRTHDDKYAKVEILSYYKDAPANPDAFTDQAATFTFRYIYQEDGSKNLQ